MSNLQAPYNTVKIVKGKTEGSLEAHRVLLIAQANGTATAKEVIKDISKSEAKDLLGDNSLAYLAVKKFKKINDISQLDVIPLATPTGDKSQGGISIVGTAKESANLNILVGDDDFLVKVAISKDDKEDAIATKIKDAINKADIPFTAKIDTTDNKLVLIDFDIDGEVGDKLTISIKQRVLGLQINTQEFGNGSGTYDVANLLDKITDRYHTIIFDDAMEFDAVETFLQDRINADNAVLGGVGIYTKQGTLSECNTTAEAKNSQTMVIIANSDEMKINAIPLLLSVEVGAIRALRLTDGADVSKYTLDATETIGGMNKASLPYHNTPISYEQPNKELTLSDLQKGNKAGLSFIIPTKNGTALGELVTLYKRDKAGELDDTFHNLNSVDTSMAIQEYMYVNTKKEYGQTRATTGKRVAGLSVSTPLSVKGFLIGLYDSLVENGLTQGGDEAEEFYTSNLDVKLDATTGYYKIQSSVLMVGQFRGLNAILAVSYQI